MRTIWLEPDGWSVGMIDQTALPHRFVTARLTSLEEAAHAISAMQIRGAPLIGATAAYGICLALRADASDEALDRAYATLLATRPTAINLKWALDEMVAVVRNRPRAERSAAAYRRAAEIAEEDIAINTAMGRQRPAADRSHCATQETRRARQCADPLQCRLACGGRCRHRDRADLSGARQRHPHSRLRRRNPAAQSGRLADRLGTRPARRAAHRDRRQYRRPSDAARPRRSGHRRHRPRHRGTATSATRSALI